MKKKYIIIITSVIVLFTIGIVSKTINTGFASNHTNNGNTPLPIPPLLEPSIEQGEKVFRITAKKSKHKFSDSLSAKTYAYGSLSYLGPTILISNNDKVAIEVKNNLRESTTFHQHGLHLPAEMDGAVFQPIKKRSTWTSKYTVNQPAGTFWYHPHLDEKTGHQVSQGLAGFIIIEDEASAALNLPNEYGIDDIPLAIQDKRIKNNKIYFSKGMMNSMMGNIGNTLITNGAVSPSFRATKSLIRLRILNASSFGIHEYSLSEKRPFYLIGNDGGLLEHSAQLTSIQLAPSERREILVDISDLKKDDFIYLITNVHKDYNANALKIIAGSFGRTNPTIPTTLVNYKKLTRTPGTPERTFILETGGSNMMFGGSSLTINGKKMDMKRVDETIKLGTTEIWRIIHKRSGSSMMAAIPHSFHPHDGSFKVISFNGAPPPPNLQGWKDTILLLEGDEAVIIKEFQTTGKFMYHCHQLEHEDEGMMGVFEVI